MNTTIFIVYRINSITKNGVEISEFIETYRTSTYEIAKSWLAEAFALSTKIQTASYNVNKLSRSKVNTTNLMIAVEELEILEKEMCDKQMINFDIYEEYCIKEIFNQKSFTINTNP